MMEELQLLGVRNIKNWRAECKVISSSSHGLASAEGSWTSETVQQELVRTAEMGN
jgi:hypothetical protein